MAEQSKDKVQIGNGFYLQESNDGKWLFLRSPDKIAVIKVHLQTGKKASQFVELRNYGTFNPAEARELARHLLLTADIAERKTISFSSTTGSEENAKQLSFKE